MSRPVKCYGYVFRRLVPARTPYDSHGSYLRWWCLGVLGWPGNLHRGGAQR